VGCRGPPIFCERRPAQIAPPPANAPRPPPATGARSTSTWPSPRHQPTPLQRRAPTRWQVAAITGHPRHRGIWQDWITKRPLRTWSSVNNCTLVRGIVSGYSHWSPAMSNNRTSAAVGASKASVAPWVAEARMIRSTRAARASRRRPVVNRVSANAPVCQDVRGGVRPIWDSRQMLADVQGVEFRCRTLGCRGPPVDVPRPPVARHAGLSRSLGFASSCLRTSKSWGVMCNPRSRMPDSIL